MSSTPLFLQDPDTPLSRSLELGAQGLDGKCAPVPCAAAFPENDSILSDLPGQQHSQRKLRRLKLEKPVQRFELMVSPTQKG